MQEVPILWEYPASSKPAGLWVRLRMKHHSLLPGTAWPQGGTEVGHGLALPRLTFPMVVADGSLEKGPAWFAEADIFQSGKDTGCTMCCPHHTTDRGMQRRRRYCLVAQERQ